MVRKLLTNTDSALQHIPKRPTYFKIIVILLKYISGIAGNNHQRNLVLNINIVATLSDIPQEIGLIFIRLIETPKRLFIETFY